MPRLARTEACDSANGPAQRPARPRTDLLGDRRARSRRRPRGGFGTEADAGPRPPRHDPVPARPATPRRALLVVPLARIRLPTARLPLEDPRVLGAAFRGDGCERRRPQGGTGERQPRGARRHDRDAPGAGRPPRPRPRGVPRGRAQGDRRLRIGGPAADEPKEHQRCGSNLIGPLLAFSVAGQVIIQGALERPNSIARGAASLAATGAAVEVFAYAERNPEAAVSRAVHGTGYEIQRSISTREPTPEQLAVGEAAVTGSYGSRPCLPIGTPRARPTRSLPFDHGIPDRLRVRRDRALRAALGTGADPGRHLLLHVAHAEVDAEDEAAGDHGQVADPGHLRGRRRGRRDQGRAPGRIPLRPESASSGSEQGAEGHPAPRAARDREDAAREGGCARIGGELLSQSASSFVEMFAGLGAARIGASSRRRGTTPRDRHRRARRGRRRPRFRHLGRAGPDPEPAPGRDGRLQRARGRCRDGGVEHAREARQGAPAARAVRPPGVRPATGPEGGSARSSRSTPSRNRSPRTWTSSGLPTPRD